MFIENIYVFIESERVFSINRFIRYINTNLWCIQINLCTANNYHPFALSYTIVFISIHFDNEVSCVPCPPGPQKMTI